MKNHIGKDQHIIFGILSWSLASFFFLYEYFLHNTAVLFGSIVVPLLVELGFNLIEHLTNTSFIYSVSNFKVLLSIVPLLLIIGLIIVANCIPEEYKAVKFHRIEKGYETV